LATGTTRGHSGSISAERSTTSFNQANQERSARPNQDILTGRAKWSHGFGRTGVLSAEYEYREGDFGYGANATDQRLRFGVEYFPALSTSRRLALRFHIAPSAMEIPASATGAGATETLYRLEGDAAVVYPFSLRWDLGVSYQRGVEYIAVLREPVFRDVTRLEMTGLLDRRVDISASAGFFVGQSALSMNSEHFDTYTGTTRARYSVSRSLAVYAEYLYYYYNLQGQASLAPDLPDVFEQHGIRAGLMLWARPVGR
jgi:hypothetical protein